MSHLARMQTSSSYFLETSIAILGWHLYNLFVVFDVFFFRKTSNLQKLAFTWFVYFAFQLQSCGRRLSGYLCGVCLVVRSRQFCCLLGQWTKLQSQASALGQRCPPVRLLVVYICLGLGKLGPRQELRLRSSSQPQINKFIFFSQGSQSMAG